MFRNYRNKRFKIISEFVTGNKILDVGYACASNPFLEDYFVVGFDQIERQDQQIHYDEYYLGDISTISADLAGQAFDTIICGELIEHLENPYALLRDLKNLLKRNGTLIITTPNPISMPMIICEFLQLDFGFYNADHTYAFLPRWVKRLLQRTGLSLKEIKGGGLWLPWGSFSGLPSIFCYQIVYVAQKVEYGGP